MSQIAHLPEPPLTPEHAPQKTYPWYVVLWLTGVDYFSTLGYQPGIAFLAAGAIAPIATAIVVAVTLLGALPTYIQVARSSYAGQGSIAMLERLIPGWRGKTFVLILLGFAATDFIITMTLSAADAAAHAVENPLLHHALEGSQLGVTMVLLSLLALVFWLGFTEAIGLAVVVGLPYLLLNAVVLVRAGAEIFAHPEAIDAWKAAEAFQTDWTGVGLAAMIVFPKLALGLSGFETGTAVMPLVNGQAKGNEPPAERIQGTKYLLTAAALIMSVLLIGSSFATTILIPAEAFAPGGPANGRALAYLAHQLLGPHFGTVYDFVTIAVLWFAGSSAMAGMLTLIPRYLPRFGMAPKWVSRPRPLVMILFSIAILVTWLFDAEVDAQAGAYATGVLVLMLSAAVAVALAFLKGTSIVAKNRKAGLYFSFIAVVFALTLLGNVIERPDGLIISSFFIAGIIVSSALSRWRRATELRVETFTFADAQSEACWQAMRGKKVNLLPLERYTAEAIYNKGEETRRHYKVEGPLAFLHVELIDNRSEFGAGLCIRAQMDEQGNYRIWVTGAVALANTIAYLSEQLDPIAIFLGLRRQNAMTQAVKYLVWGEGEVGILVYQILVKYWEETPEDDVRPLIFLMSE